MGLYKSSIIFDLNFYIGCAEEDTIVFGVGEGQVADQQQQHHEADHRRQVRRRRRPTTETVFRIGASEARLRDGGQRQAGGCMLRVS